MVDVELVEDQPPQEPDPVGEWLRRTTAAWVRGARRAAAFVVARVWRRPAVRWITIGVVATLVAVPVVNASRERARLAALAQVPGVLQPLHPGLRVLYSVADQQDGTALEDGFLLAGSVVGSISLLGENSTLVALDAATGARRWSTPLGDRDAWNDAVPVCTAAGAVVACQVTGGPGHAGGSTVTATWALDPTDGHLVRGVTYGDHVRAVVAGGVMVVAQQVAGPDRAPRSGPWTVTWRVTGQDPATGAALWTWTSPPLGVAAENDPADPFHDPADYGSQLWHVSSPDGATDQAALRIGDDTWLFGPDGAVRLHLTRTGGWSLEAARGGALVRRPMDHGAVLKAPTPELLLDDGTWRPIEGTPLATSVDDGSAPDLVFVTSGTGGQTTLTAVDRHTGAPRWQASLGPTVVGPLFTLSAVVLEGRVYTGAQDLRSLDAATGASRWTVPGAGGALSTDGKVLVVQTADAQGFPRGVQAYSLAGRPQWHSDVRAMLAPQGTPLNLSLITFALAGRHIGVVRSDGTVAVLG